MTVATMEQRVWQRLEQDPAAPVTTEPEVLHALNQAERTFVLLTLCLETTAVLALTAGKVFYGVRNLFPNYLRPLRLMSGDPFARLRPCRLADLDALTIDWQTSASVDPASRYFTLGINLFGVWRAPPIDVAANFTYAYEPPALVVQNAIPQVPTEYHETLVKFAVVWIRLKEGSTELAKVMPLFAEFIADAKKLGAFVRARSVASGYDSLPFELEKGFDMARMLKTLMPKQGGSDGKPATG